jgi:xanthine dehydrogenase/oxidase
LKNSPNPVGVLSSKAVGEPPLALGCAGLFAAEQAINAAKKQLGINTDYQLLAAPATVDVIQQSLGLSPSMFILQ